MSLPHGAFYFFVIDQVKTKVSKAMPKACENLSDFYCQCHQHNSVLHRIHSADGAHRPPYGRSTPTFPWPSARSLSRRA